LPYKKTRFEGQPAGDYVTLPYNLDVPLENSEVPAEILDVDEPSATTTSPVKPVFEIPESEKPDAPPVENSVKDLDSKGMEAKTPKVKNLQQKNDDGADQ
jgi:hypothetical protein